MNVLAVNLGDDENRVIQDWRPRLTAHDRLQILRCGASQLACTSGTHDLEQILVCTEYRRWPKKAFEVTFNNLRRIRKLLSTSFEPLLFWNLVGGFLWDELLADIKSFNPDIVDLRWTPGSGRVKSKLSASLPNLAVLPFTARNDLPVGSPHRYDPRIRVSIVLPVYNGARFLRESIESCLKQTHGNIELIIVDDCSTDSTPDIINEYARRDDRVVSIRNSSNLHLPGALNVGFQNSRGDLLSWTSHDNYYALDAMETMVGLLCSRPEIDLVYSAFYQIDEHARIDPRIIYLPDPRYADRLNVVGPCFLYRRGIYEKIGGYRPEMEYQEDYEYWLRASRRFRMMRLHIPIYYYRRHEQSMTARRRRDPSVVAHPVN